MMLACFAMSLYLKSTPAFAYVNERTTKKFRSLTLNASKEDSVVIEYVRVSYVAGEIRAYYEDGKIEDLILTLNLKERGWRGITTDKKLSTVFFEIAKYLRTKGYYLITSNGTIAVGQYLEYIYRKETKVN